MLKQKVQQLANELHASVISNRRHLHANPELSFKEYKTSAFVKERLDQLDIQWTSDGGNRVLWR
jgi:amidohydrolase